MSARNRQAADVVVVGMGVGGEAVAGTLVEAGLDVVGVEAELVGGECPYWACIPTKMMVRAGNLLAEARRITGMAGDASLGPDWAPVAQRIRDEATDNWDDKAAVERFTGKGGRFVRGRATVLGPREVEVPGEGVFEARRGIVLATGSTPAIPPIEGLEDTPYWTNREAVGVRALPASLVVLGGGAVGVEIGQAFARFGVGVTVVESDDRLLGKEEPEASELVAQALRAEGIEQHLGTKAVGVRHDGHHFAVELDGNGSGLRAEALLVATGRRPRVTDDTFTRLGLEPGSHVLEVDDRLRVTDGVWAVGDVTGQGAFTHVATYQADVAGRNILGRPGPPADYRALPRVTFTDPEIGSVGLTEKQALERGIDVVTGTASVPSSTRGWIHRAGNNGVIKLVADADAGVLLGATSAGPEGGEVLGALAVAIQGRVPVETLRHMIYAYPTFHRGIQEALRNLTS